MMVQAPIRGVVTSFTAHELSHLISCSFATSLHITHNLLIVLLCFPQRAASTTMNSSPVVTAIRRSVQSTRPRTVCPREAARLRLSRPQARWIGDYGGKPPKPPGTPEASKVVAPKTRLAVGIVFVGTLIYSMVPIPVIHATYRQARTRS